MAHTGNEVGDGRAHWHGKQATGSPLARCNTDAPHRKQLLQKIFQMRDIRDSATVLAAHVCRRGHLGRSPWLQKAQQCVPAHRLGSCAGALRNNNRHRRSDSQPDQQQLDSKVPAVRSPTTRCKTMAARHKCSKVGSGVPAYRVSLWKRHRHLHIFSKQDGQLAFCVLKAMCILLHASHACVRAQVNLGRLLGAGAVPLVAAPLFLMVHIWAEQGTATGGQQRCRQITCGASAAASESPKQSAPLESKLESRASGRLDEPQ